MLLLWVINCSILEWTLLCCYLCSKMKSVIIGLFVCWLWGQFVCCSFIVQVIVIYKKKSIYALYYCNALPLSSSISSFVLSLSTWLYRCYHYKCSFLSFIDCCSSYIVLNFVSLKMHHCLTFQLLCPRQRWYQKE